MKTKKAARDAGVDFVPQPAVRWFSPLVLARSALRVVLTGTFGSYLDKRELQAILPGACLDRYGDEDDLWVDFVADSGDAFDAVYSVAWLVSREKLHVEGADIELPRAQLLILGGDEAYPSAGPSAYQDRLIGPYRSALPLLEDDEAPSLVVIPGNHDWHDGLTAFLRAFTQQRWMGAWRGIQRRSYAAVQLPHDWWLWTIDLQKGTDLDEPQQRYFETAARSFAKSGEKSGAKVVLCVADPAWVDAAHRPEAYGALDYIERKLITPAGGRVLVMLTGDSHHYAHYIGDDGTHKITAGGGGAFLHPTHDLPNDFKLESPTPGVSAPPVTSAVTYQLGDRCYPEKKTSRRLAWGALGLPIRNPSFLVVLGLLHLLLFVTNRVALKDLAGKIGFRLDAKASTLGLFDLKEGLLGSPFSLFVLACVMTFMIAFAKPHASVSSRKPFVYWVIKVAMGVIHGSGHIAAVLAVELLSVGVAGSLASGPWFTVLLTVMIASLGGVAGAFVMGSYLALSCALLNTHGNEAFSCQGLTRHKCFLRMHFGPDGRLTVYPLGIDRAWHRWRPGDHRPGEPELGKAMLVPDGPGSDAGPRVHLIEAPYEIG